MRVSLIPSCLVVATDPIQPLPPFPTIKSIGPTSTPPVTIHLLSGQSGIFNFSRPTPIRNRFQYQFNYNISTGSTTFLTALHSCSSTCATQIPANPYGGSPYIYDTIGFPPNGPTSLTSAAYNPKFPYYYSFTTSNSGSYPNCWCNDTTTLTSVGVDEVWYFRSGPASADTDITANAAVIDMCDGHGDELDVTNSLGCACDPGWFGNQCGSNNGGYKFSPCCTNEIFKLDGIGNANLTINSSLNTPERSLQPQEKMFTFSPNSSLNVTGGISYSIKVWNKNASNPLCQSGYPGYPFRMYAVAACDPTALQACYNTLGTYSQADLNLGYSYYDYYRWNSGDYVELVYDVDTFRQRCGCVNSYSQPFVLNQEISIIGKISTVDPSCTVDVSVTANQFCLNGGTYYYGKGCSCRSGFGGRQCQNVCTSSLGGPDCDTPVYTITNGVPFTWASNVIANRTYFRFQSLPPAPNGNQRFLQIKVTGEANNPTGIRIAGMEHCDTTSCPIQHPYYLDPASYGGNTYSIWPFDFGVHQYGGSYPVGYATFIQEGLMDPEFIAGMPTPAVQSRGYCGCNGKNASDSSYIENWNILVTHLNVAGLATRPNNTLTITVSSVDVCNGHGRYDSDYHTCTCDAGYERGANSAISTTSSFYTPSCLPCQNTDPSITTTLNCSNVVSVVSDVNGMTMPVTQPSGPQIPGQLPTMSTMLFPYERAIFKYTTLPKNPRGNPWMFQFHTGLSVKQYDIYGYNYYLFAGGVHTCSTSINCTNLIPNTIIGRDTVWEQDPSQQLIQQPMDVGSYGVSDVDYSEQPTLYAFHHLRNVNMEFNPSAYYLRNSSLLQWQYQQVKVGNNTVIPQECLCELPFYGSQLGSSTNFPTPSTESWTFATSYLLGVNANRMVMNGNFSDICAGHGSFDGSSYGCTCDIGYYGFGCGSATHATPYQDPTYYYWVPKAESPASQCCTGQFTRASPSTLYANNTNGAVTTQTTVPITTAGAFITGDPKATPYDSSTTNYVGVITYDIDPWNANSGLSYTFRFVLSNATLAEANGLQVAYPSGYNVQVRGYMICNSWTTEQCFNRLTLTGELTRDGNWDGNQYYTFPSNGNYYFCGCTETYAQPKQIMFMIVNNAKSVMDVIATPPIIDCPSNKGRFNMTGGVGTCTCTNGFEGPTCSNKPTRLTTYFQYNSTLSTQTGQTTFTSFASDVDSPSYSTSSYGSVLAQLRLGEPTNTLNLTVTAHCNYYGNGGSVRYWEIELLRCFDEVQKRNWNETDKFGLPVYYRTPDETWSYGISDLSKSLDDLAALGRQTYYNWQQYSSPDNPFRHCDRTLVLFTSSQTDTAHIQNSYGSLAMVETGGANAVTNMVPYDRSPCINSYPVSGTNLVTYPDGSCTNSSTYYLIRVVNKNQLSTGCKVSMTQTTSFTCYDSFVECSANSNGCTRSATNTSICGNCNSNAEGIGCLAERKDYTEMVNQEKTVFTSSFGEPMRVSLQVSPSNSISIRLKFWTNFNCTSTACLGHVGKVWIRGRVGSHPPELTTRYVIDEATKTAYVDSDGLDSELLVKPAAITQLSSTGASGSSQVTSSTTGGGYGGSAYRRLFSREEVSDSDSFEFEADVSANGEVEIPQPQEQPHWLYRTLSYFYRPHSTSPSFEHAYQSFSTTPVTNSNATYRNDDFTTDPSITHTINFPSEKQYGDVRVVANAFLYLDIYQGNMMDASTSSNGRIEGSNNAYATNMEVEIVINDTLGTLLGWIAVGILGTFAFILFVYLIYLRCRYGSISAGVETSILKKAEVTKAVLSPKEQERVARKKAKKRAAQLAKEQAEDRAAGCCKKFLMILPLLIVFILLLTFEMLKVLFNISILHTSVGSFLPVVDFDKVTKSVGDALDSLGLAKVRAVFDRFNDLFDFLGIFNQVSLKWNCGGALSMFAPVVILLGSIVLVVILQKDYFLRFALSIRGSTEGTRRTGRKLRAAIAMVLSTILLYFLQSSILVLTQVVASTWNIKRSCSVNDHTLVYLGRWLCIFFIVMLFYVSGLAFAGIKTFNFQSLVIGWFSGVWALLQLTVGVWRQSTVARFDIAARARAFDIDDNHDQNPEEAVMELQASSRGLMWTAFPVGIVLTKVTEQINAPPVFLIGNYLGVDITTPRWNRWLRWVVGMGRMLAVFYTVWSANTLSVMIAFGLTAFSVFLILILPNDYHKKKWEKSHPVTEQITTNEFVQSVQLTKI